MLKLSEPIRPLANFFASGLFELKQTLGPILWQLPPQLGFHADRLEQFLTLLPRDLESALALARRRDERVRGRACLRIDANRPLRHALEVRHPSFVDPAFVDLLRRQNVALVVADTAGKFPFLDDVTADFVYVRLHGDTELYVSGYSDDALDRWAARINEWSSAGRDVYCYFDNDAKVHAPFDAMRLAGKLGMRGVHATQ
jgi:uncharacterized protein YecE (DUF72 family)